MMKAGETVQGGTAFGDQPIPRLFEIIARSAFGRQARFRNLQLPLCPYVSAGMS